MLAEAQFESGDPQQAVQSAEQGLHLDPSSEACRVQLSRVRLAQGNLDASFAAIAPAIEAAATGNDFTRAAAHLSAILEAEPGYVPALVRLAEIRAPTLVLVGDHDLDDKVAEAEQLAAAIFGARAVVIPGVAHMLNMEAPEIFNRLVLDFLEGSS